MLQYTSDYILVYLPDGRMPYSEHWTGCELLVKWLKHV